MYEFKLYSAKLVKKTIRHSTSSYNYLNTISHDTLWRAVFMTGTCCPLSETTEIHTRKYAQT